MIDVPTLCISSVSTCLFGFVFRYCLGDLRDGAANRDELAVEVNTTPFQTQ